MAQTIVPIISSGTAGPLGVLHLPRLWTKLTLAAHGSLPEGYDESGQGFDAMTLAALGLDRDKVIAYVREKKPTYMQFEKWIVEQRGGHVDRAAIEKHNAAVRGYNHSDEYGSSVRAATGITDPNVKDAVTLNIVEDLHEVHRLVTSA
jgi:hypothetical protein